MEVALVQITQLLTQALQEELEDLVVEVENIIMVETQVALEMKVVFHHLKEMMVEIVMLLVNLHQELKALLLEVEELVDLVQVLLGTLLLRKQEMVELVQLIQFQALL
jgi:hypothetical protein